MRKKYQMGGKMAQKEDLDKLLDNFRTTIFEPFKSQILDRVDTLETKVDELPGKMDKLETDFKIALDFNDSEIKRMDNTVINLRKENKELHEKVDTLTDLIHKQNAERVELKHKVIDLEDRSRRDNLVIDGLSDSQGESKNDCESKARTFMQKTMKIHNAQKLCLGRVHRLGQYRPNKTRPTIIKFDLYKQREAVWNGRRNLPSKSPITIKENFSKETDKARVHLMPIMRAARKLDYFAKMEGQRLILSKGDFNAVVTMDTLENLPSELNPEKVFTPCKNNVTLFYTVNSPHSNFYPCKFVENGKDYNCVEQYFVYKNATCAGDNAIAQKVMKLEDPVAIKNCGKGIRPLDNDIKMENMKKGMSLKYSQNEYLLKCLRDTGSTTLAEANPHDSYWGIGMSLNNDRAFEGSWDGQNITGKLAMEVRSELCPVEWN